ncbi:DUF2489 domain-containing protein [Pseudomonas sp. MYb185]|uniref:DUF2489 domain-containing protein n=1 Tax=Pseudomonas sp. MYb185 TaxID=1848729 RepID=UPI000CFA9645|nr:DUF2489 domain-containing protein [Pseudomonas sp. MYb185]PRB84506.1 hypothetical protein CQ007_01655 [Pseudomonas sp. MYb185]
MNKTDWLVVAGLIIIFGLAVYAALLWHRVWRNQQRQARQQQERNTRLEGDIRILAQSLLSGQLPMIEGAIRIKVLLDNYSGPRRAELDIQVLDTIYDATAHIPTHQGWKDLPQAQRRLHQRLLDTLEQQHGAELQQLAQRLGSGLQ